MDVLLVEDDASLADGIARILLGAGHAVEARSSGSDALEATRCRRFDLMLLDIGLPGIDGYEVLRRLKLNPLHQHIPVVILTASDLGKSAQQRALALGAVRYLEKPMASGDLLAEIERILS